MAGLDIDVDELFRTDLTEAGFVHLRHPGEANLIHLSRRDEAQREVLLHLTTRGFLAYKFANDSGAVTSFVKAGIAPRFWARHTSFGLREHDGVCYQLELPQHAPARRLLVIFSSMSQVDQMYEAGFSARYFMRNLSQGAQVHAMGHRDPAHRRPGGAWSARSTPTRWRSRTTKRGSPR
ncbi:hypothetical protein H1235_08790 [Pseudoxanthomonas sp. NC8]|nr:hypothetical protein H1235_08790 [Pseudoxanthomonas sp. NC8]